MTTRAEFLDSVRNRIRDGLPVNPLRPIANLRNGPISYTPDLTNTMDRFKQAAEEAGAELIGSEQEDLERLLQQVVADVAPNVAAVSRDPECAGIEELLSAAGVRIAPLGDLGAVASADLGITGALAGVALTGSIVVDSRRAGSRLVSLLPSVHLVLMPTERIVATPGDVLRNMAVWFSDSLPSNIVFITGPSRSADIELEITKGVHGPRRLLIAFPKAAPQNRLP